jgi:sulfur-oxidizing protein SoxY
MSEKQTSRRQFVKGAISATTLALVASSGLLLPSRVLAHWPSDAFNAESVEDALLALLGQAEIAKSDELNFKVGSPPSYAVNGASVPIVIESNLENIQRVAILVEKNPLPLAMVIEPTAEVMLPFKSMIKMADDSQVIAVVRAGDKLYKTSRFVEVDIGGCA